MSEPSNKRIVLVGLFVFLGLTFLVTGILMVGNVHETFKKKMKVVSLFDDVSGLQPGNNIWFSGVKIGTVSTLNFYGNNQVEVIMKIETKVQQYIRKNAKVKISTDGVIGNKILIIYGGSSHALPVEEGDTLNVEKTFTSDDMINTLQENNKNFLAITKNFKVISTRLASGDGTMGKLLTDNAVYTNLNATTVALQAAALQAQHLITSLNNFSTGLNKKGSLANELVTDTILYNSLKYSVLHMQHMADTATALVNDLNRAEKNPDSPLGVLLRNEESGERIKVIIKNLESSSKKLDEDLEAAQHSFLLRSYFKKKAKK